MSQGRQQGRSTKAKMEKVLGEYTILAELARGGMGRVYVARRSGQAGFERYFAIKVMHQQLNDDQKWVMMLLDEAHIASRLHHPNVVPVLDIGTFGEGYYLVMDYVEGCSLQQLLKKSPDVRPVKAIVSILIDSLRGLHAVHTLRGMNDEELHVVHRDVSPHNLLLGVDGGCRVTDFGIAKARQRFTDTDVGTHKGKLAFMAPEQMRGLSTVDHRVDVWAAGVTLYKSLTGVHPFRQDNDAATIQSIIIGEIPLPSTVGLKPPAAFDAVIMRSLQRDPEQRFATAEEFAEALRAVALQENLLGSSSDVAQWVKATCGAELSERRKKLAAIPKNAEENTLGTSSLPKLWFNQEGGNTSTSGSAPHTTIEPGFQAAGSSFAAISRPRALTSVAVLAIALAIGVGVYLNRGVHTEPVVQHQRSDHSAAPAAAAAPAPEPATTSVADPPVSPSAVVPRIDPPAPPPESTTRPALAEQDSRPKRGRPVAPVKARKSATPSSSDIVTSAKQAFGARDASPPTHSPAPAVAAPAPAAPVAPAPAERKAPGLDKNPYVLGE